MQGEEIGMDDVWISYNDTVDPAACNAGPDRYQYTTRDPERTPFQWDSTKNSGFSSGNHTWLPISPNYTQVNVEKELSDDSSHLWVYRNMTALRRAVIYKPLSLVTFTEQNVLIIRRSGQYLACQTCYIYTMVNIGSGTVTIDLTKQEPSLAGVGIYAIVSVSSKHRVGEVVSVNNVAIESKESFVLLVDVSTTYEVIHV